MIFIIGMLMISSCYNKHGPAVIPEPSGLIVKDSIVLILADIEIIESALRQKQNRGQEINDIRDDYYKSIFASYGVSRVAFDSSMLYYRQDLETINEIYEEVITRLSVIASEVEHE
ncbi:MAG: DUF4296 domain-containing protein [Bacteroidales bacterium]|nr:DUF4296 domain-containing protein [Bacteroidales bacterium]